MIRDEIAAETRYTRKYEEFDPYAGNLLEAVTPSSSKTTPTAFLAFPMGETNCGLSKVVSSGLHVCIAHSLGAHLRSVSVHLQREESTMRLQTTASRSAYVRNSDPTDYYLELSFGWPKAE